MDKATRATKIAKNPAALLALMWYKCTGGRGLKDMVILPYKDRLLLLSRYLQQLIMESLGKELDLGGNKVEQGISVYGNKGSTDQHAYVQQLRDGVNNFFATFIEVLSDRKGASPKSPRAKPRETTCRRSCSARAKRFRQRAETALRSRLKTARRRRSACLSRSTTGR